MLFWGTRVWSQLLRLVKSSKSFAEIKNKLEQLGNIDCDCLTQREQFFFSFICFLTLFFLPITFFMFVA